MTHTIEPSNFPRTLFSRFGAEPGLRFHPLVWLITGSALIFFACSSLKHLHFSSTAFDLGIFDQAIYLISQGKPPVSSIVDYHILGDHAALILYPLSLLYKIHPSVYWLFAVQALGLASGALPTWVLTRQAGLDQKWAMTIAITYLLYPVLFNVNLFDFHPEVLAPAALLGAVLAARSNQIVWFTVAIAFVLSLKAVLALNILAMGIWLLIFEKNRRCGAIALFAGVAWFLIATQSIIPTFSGHPPAAVGRYADFGDSPLEIAKNLLLKPELMLGKVFTIENLRYVCLLMLPVVWGVSSQHLYPLIGAAPTIALNVLTDYQTQKDLSVQYSVSVVPFLMLVAISTLASGRGWQSRRGIIWASLLAFGVTFNFGAFAPCLQPFDATWRSTREAIAKIHTQEGVLADSLLLPQLTHRRVAEMLRTPKSLTPNVKYVLLSLKHSWGNTRELTRTMVDRLKQDPQFRLRHRREGVFLFVRKP
jgi:uncharacterized membrane protein